MPINKVNYGDRTLIDLSSDTITADKLLSGYTAHDKAGNLVAGTAKAASATVSNGKLTLSDGLGSVSGGVLTI